MKPEVKLFNMLADLKVPKAWRNQIVNLFSKQFIKPPAHPDFKAISEFQPTLRDFVFRNMIKTQ